MSLYRKLIIEYKKIFPKGNINSKDYNTTIIRNIMIFFLYKYYKKTKQKRHQIIKNFSIKYKNNVYDKVNKVTFYIDNPKTLSKQRNLFTYFYFKFNKVYINHEKNN